MGHLKGRPKLTERRPPGLPAAPRIPATTLSSQSSWTERDWPAQISDELTPSPSCSIDCSERWLNAASERSQADWSDVFRFGYGQGIVAVMSEMDDEFKRKASTHGQSANR